MRPHAAALLKGRTLWQDDLMAKKFEIGPITKVVKSDEEWKTLLAPDAYQVLRHEATERAFTNHLHDNKEAGDRKSVV